MKPEQIIKQKINNNGLKMIFVASKVGMNKDALSKSLNSQRELKATELLNLCSFLGLDLSDFEVNLSKAFVKDI